MFNSFSIGGVKKISSIRANIFEDYKFKYGNIGYLLALAHYFIIKNFNLVIAMHIEMHNQIKKYYYGEIKIINNFIEEEYLENFRKNVKSDKKNIELIFVGTLTDRKNPILAINLLKQLIEKGYNVNLKIIGNGKLRLKLEERVKKLNLLKQITFYGNIDEPYEMLSASDIMIMPSFSEGTSRAMLEALFLGILCIGRSIGGNEDLITDGYNGYLFHNDDDLLGKTLLAIKDIRLSNNEKKNLLLPNYSQKLIINKYIEILNDY